IVVPWGRCSFFRFLLFHNVCSFAFQFTTLFSVCQFGYRGNIVEGPMADDTIWDFVNGFISGKISRSVFWEYARFKHPTHQISFHTVNALRCLTFERSEHIHDGKTER
ncbi:DUF3990 domain-containing protein, partial [Faecalibacterium sp. An121]|uniref:DUF3990 domain-containing protein n=1 Tax=Faecalibacterium sp. An121 TaxID=1965550 RepID=UPI001FA84AA8